MAVRLVDVFLESPCSVAGILQNHEALLYFYNETNYTIPLTSAGSFSLGQSLYIRTVRSDRRCLSSLYGVRAAYAC